MTGLDGAGLARPQPAVHEQVQVGVGVVEVDDDPGFATKVALILNPPEHKPAPDKRPVEDDAGE